MLRTGARQAQRPAARHPARQGGGRGRRRRIKGAIGSGPFRFRPDLWQTGSSMILERNPDYVSRPEPADFLAGGKHVKIDTLDLRVMPDANTGSTALIAGEVDYMQFLPFDNLELLEKARNVKVFGAMGIHMYPKAISASTTPSRPSTTPRCAR